jgi:hypothetical protein
LEIAGGDVVGDAIASDLAAAPITITSSPS